MKTVLKLSLFGLMISALLLTFCSTEDGTDGAVGPAGEQGISGIDGADGNANVMSSDWYTPASYTLSSGLGSINLLEHNQAASEITQEILDNGIILVYGKLSGYTSTVWSTNTVALMPIVLTYGSPST